MALASFANGTFEYSHLIPNEQLSIVLNSVIIYLIFLHASSQSSNAVVLKFQLDLPRYFFIRRDFIKAKSCKF